MSNLNQHKPGYKHTPLGLIPEEWEVLTIEELLDRNIIVSHLDGNHGGLYPRAEEFVSSGVPYLSANNFFNGYVDFKGCKYLHPDRAKQFRKGIAKDGDVLFAHNATVGPVAILETDLEYVVLSTTATYFRCNDKVLSNLYLREYFTSYYFVNQYSRVMGQSTRNQVPITTQRTFYTILPKLPEQRKIAAILSIWDEAIIKTQQLIYQLQQRNKGLMQQLLTGKKRLKGFEGDEWKKLHATEIFKSVSVKNNGTERLLSATQDRGIIPRDMLEARVTMPTGETGSFKLVEIGDFVISLRSFQGGIEYSEYRGLVSPAYTVLKPTKSISTSFFKHYFKSYDFIGHLAVAVIGIRDGKQVSYEDFSILKLPYPSVEEQEAIATVLDAAVNEVKLYEQKLAALQQQKKGLMQKLLTGEVRVKIDNNQN